MTTSALPGVRNSTIRQAGAGLPPAISTADAIFTRRRYCQTAARWSQREWGAPAFLPVPNCTTRQAETGLLPAVSTPHATDTRRPCCPTARSLSQPETVPTVSSAARSCTKLRRLALLHGRLQHQGRDRARHLALRIDCRKTAAPSQRHSVRSARFQRALSGILPAEKTFGRMPNTAPKMRALPLTALVPQITILDEYRTRPRGEIFDPKPHAEERNPKGNRACESPPHN